MEFDLSHDRGFTEATNFLFPIANEETGIHHFSHLSSLKLWNVDLLVQNEREIWSKKVVESYNLFQTKPRIKEAFPALRNLAISNPFRRIYTFANHLLTLRAPYLESLHFQRFSCDPKVMNAPFDSLSELCLTSDACLRGWINFLRLRQKVMKLQVRKKNKRKEEVMKIDKIFADLGVLRKRDTLRWSLLPNAIKLVLDTTRLSTPKHIRVKMFMTCAPSKGESPRVIIDQIVQAINESHNCF